MLTPANALPGIYTAWGIYKNDQHGGTGRNGVNGSYGINGYLLAITGDQNPVSERKMPANRRLRLDRGERGIDLWLHNCGAIQPIVDDLIAYQLNPEEYMLVVNASNREKDWAHFQSMLDRFPEAEMENVTSDLIMMSLQAAVIFSLLFIAESEAVLLVAAATFVGFNYGTNLSLFPSVTKDYYGIKNFGMNYGLLFSAWGIGGFIFPRVSQMIVAQTGTQHTAYLLCSILLVAGAIISIMTNAPGEAEQKQGSLVQFKEKMAFAKAQPVDVYLGARHI